MAKTTRRRLGSRLMAGIVASVLAAAFLGLPSAEASAGALTAFTDDDLADGFLATVFGAEYGGHRNLKKYTTPVVFSVVNSARIDRQASVRALVARLPTLVPGLKARMAKRGETGNFQIHIVDYADYRPMARELAGRKWGRVGGECIVRLNVGARGIAGSTAVISSDKGEKVFQRCLTAEILQGLGPMNDDKSLTQSMFNDHTHHARLMPFDRAILAALYDPRMRHGMTRREATAILPEVLARVRQVAD